MASGARAAGLLTADALADVPAPPAAGRVRRVPASSGRAGSRPLTAARRVIETPWRTAMPLSVSPTDAEARAGRGSGRGRRPGGGGRRPRRDDQAGPGDHARLGREAVRRGDRGRGHAVGHRDPPQRLAGGDRVDGAERGAGGQEGGGHEGRAGEAKSADHGHDLTPIEPRGNSCGGVP